LKSESIFKTPATESSCSTNEDEVHNNTSISQETSSTLLPCIGDIINSVLSISEKHKYDEIYLEIGFIETNDGQPLYVIFSNIFLNSSMYPQKLHHCYDKVHPDHKENPLDFFKQKYQTISC